MLLSNDSTVDVHRSKSPFASSLMFVSESATTQLSLSLTCAHDILLVTILTLPISISSLLSCTLAPGSCEEGCKPILHQTSLALTGPLAGDCAETCLFSASGYGAEGLCVSFLRTHTLPFSPTHPYDRREQRPHKEQKQAGEARWLK